MIARLIRWLLEPPKRFPPPELAPPPPPPAPPPTTPPEKPKYHEPTGREMRRLLHEREPTISTILPLSVRVGHVKYSFIYLFTHSAWYSVAYVFNNMKLPSLVGFVRGRQTEAEMMGFIKKELIRKKKAKLLKELRQKRALGDTP